MRFSSVSFLNSSRYYKRYFAINSFLEINLKKKEIYLEIESRSRVEGLIDFYSVLFIKYHLMIFLRAS